MQKFLLFLLTTNGTAFVWSKDGWLIIDAISQKHNKKAALLTSEQACDAREEARKFLPAPLVVQFIILMVEEA